jgi:phosphoserine phosphatase
MSRLAVFDLDNTLLTGDSEVLWVDHLLVRGLLDGSLADANAEMGRRYRMGVASPAEFSAFYASIFAGRTPAHWQPILAEFVDSVIRPRIPAAARALNMREGKIGCLRRWLAARGDDPNRTLARAIFYSDSINDLPLLQAVGEPVAVDPDPHLAIEAAARGWPALHLERTPFSTHT